MSPKSGHGHFIIGPSFHFMVIIIFCLALSVPILSQPGQPSSDIFAYLFNLSRGNQVRASFSYSPVTPAAGQPVQFSDSSTGSPSSWAWNFGDGATSSSRNPSHAFGSSGYHRVTLTVQTATHSSRTSRLILVTGAATLGASFTFSPAAPVAGQAVQFTDASTGGPSSWAWNFGDGATSTAQNPSHAFASAGTYTVTLTASAGSTSNQTTRTITVTAALAASFTFSPAAPVAGQAVQFTDASTGGPTSWAWNFGDGATSTAQNPSHAFASAGTYTVTLTASAGSTSNQTSRTVTVTTALAASFTFSPASPVAGQTVQFTDTSTGTPTSWTWTFGDGGTSTLKNPTHAFAAAGTYSVSLTAAAGSASNKATRTVTVAASLTASFTFTPATPVIGQTVSFTDTSTGGATSWQWDFGDGASSTLQNVNHSYAAAGPYTVTLTLNGGAASTHQIINVSPATTLTASFTYSPSSPAAGASIQFTDTSTGSPTSWHWDFGDGATSTIQNPTHSFASTGSFGVTLTVSNGSGTDSEIRTLAVGQASTLIPEDRVIDWGNAGVFVNGVKGIPNYPVGVNAKNAPYGAKGDGVTDDTTAIKNAIAACPAGQAVLLPQGNYHISGTLLLNKGVVVRGEGPDKTKITQSGSVHIFRVSGSGSSAVTDVASGFTKGSTTIVVANAGSFKAGDVVAIDELNDPSFVSVTGVGTCTWCGRYGVNGARAMGETKLVKSVSGSSITFTRPLHFTYKAEFLPQLVKLSGAPVVNAGIENLAMEAVQGVSDGHSVFMSNCAYCWVKGVESANTAKKHVELQSGAYSNEVRDSYFHDCQFFTSDRGYGVNISLQSSDNLVENNILYHLHYAIALEASGAGNVIAYNYQERTEHYQADWFIQSMGTHGAQTYMNLWEGNIAGMIDFDNYWGSGSHQMVLRNHLTRDNPGTPVSSNICAAIVDAMNYYDSFLGNILGTPGCGGAVEQIPYRSSYNNPVIWKIGFNCCSATGNPTDPKTAETLIRHGNFDYVTNAVTWDPAIADRTIPDSLYLTAKPAFFGSLVWPPFTPERAGFAPAALNKIPAQVHYETGPKVGLPFNPNYTN